MPTALGRVFWKTNEGAEGGACPSGRGALATRGGCSPDSPLLTRDPVLETMSHRRNPGNNYLNGSCIPRALEPR